MVGKGLKGIPAILTQLRAQEYSEMRTATEASVSNATLKGVISLLNFHKVYGGGKQIITIKHNITQQGITIYDMTMSM